MNIPYDPSSYSRDVKASAIAIAERLKAFPMPEFCLTLGSGLRDLIAQMDVQLRIPYAEVGLLEPSVEGHAGELIYGAIADVPVLVLSGRIHYYESAHKPHGIMDVVYATHVMASLGIRRCFTTNAVGALNPAYGVGDLMIIESHINLIPNPVTGPRLDFGDDPYFPPMNDAYGVSLRKLVVAAAEVAGVRPPHTGTYIAVTGRTFELSAECRAFRIWGADVVGMSTAPEILAATSRGMQTIGVSIVTNVVAEDGTNATSHDEVLATLEDPGLRMRLATVFSNFFALWKLEHDSSR